MRILRPAGIAMLVLAGCSPVRDSAMYVVDGVRMEITRDRTVPDTSGVIPPPAFTPEGSVTLGPMAVSRGVLIRREDGAVVTEDDRPRADAAFRLYCAARGERAPVGPLLHDRPDRPTGFFGLCRDK